MKLNEPIKLPSDVLSQLNLHIAGVALLVVLNLILLVRLGISLRDTGSGRAEQLQAEQLTLKELQVQSARLNGLPEKVELSRKAADKFYAQRIPANYSSILAELGAVTGKNTVRFTRASYTQAPAIGGLVELRIDANFAGEYSGMMHVINGLERDKTFFVISGLTLTGQQGGLVNLRLKLTTYLHAADAKDLPPSSPGPNPDDAAPAAPSTEQSSLGSDAAPAPVGEGR